MRVSYNTAKVNIRISPELKVNAENILHAVGLNAAEAIRLFYTHVCCQHGLPFEIKIPNAETLKAMEETEKGIGLIKSVNLEDFFRKTGLSDVKNTTQKILRKRHKARGKAR